MKLVAALLMSLLVPAGSAGTCNQCDGTSAGGGEGTITVVHGVSDAVPGRGPGRPPVSPAQDYSYVNEYLAPICGGNGLHDAGNLCAAAVTSCPALDQVRFWVWHQTVRVAVGPPEVVTEGEWHQEPGSFCLGPDDPGVPSLVAALARAQDLFEQRVRQLDPPTITSVPGPRTLVHYPTTFDAGGTAPFSFGVDVAGLHVQLSVAAQAYDWVFGDGERARTTLPSTTHTYAEKDQVTTRVDVTWGGTFTVDGSGEQFPIDPPAHTTGVPAVVDVVEALAENRG
ncbi:MAG: hypothetical protein JWN31_1611 [Frankiales bacterium]|nr:hypothetical protein [Frankiales bacterium]